MISESKSSEKRSFLFSEKRIFATVLSERCEMSLGAQAQGDGVHLTGGQKARWK